MSQRQMASALINMYKSVSSLKLTKEDRGVKRIFNQTLRTLEVTNGTWPDFTTSEVRAALSSLNPSKAAGTDKINPRNLRHLEPKAVLFLQQLLNKSWESTSIPQGWQVADIRPVQKSGKDPQKLDSYRPISLTSTMSKVMELLVTNSNRYEDETRRLLSENGCSTEDQLLPLSQSINDGFQCSSMNRTD